MTLKALVIDNGLGSIDAFPPHEQITFDSVTTGPGFAPDLLPYDILIVPNGADHVAMFRIREQVRQFLDAGKVVFCFCGWFMDWLPGNRWIHDNTKLTRDMRHFARNDPHGILEDVDLAQLDHNSHGISGWWACGYIETANPNSVIIADTWGRAIMVADETTTNGLMFLTASGPLGDYSRGRSKSVISTLYHNLLRHTLQRLSSSPVGQCRQA